MIKNKRNNFFNKNKKQQNNISSSWVPKTKEIEKEKEEEKQQSLLLMEEEKKKKKVYSSLPSNYVTLAQLQERWFLNQQKQKEDHLPVEQRHVEVAPPTNESVSRLNLIERNLRGNRDDLTDNRRVIDVESEEGRKSVAGAGIGVRNAVERNRDELASNRRAIGVESEDSRKSVVGTGIVDNVTVSRTSPVERKRGGKVNNRRGVESEDRRQSVIGDGISGNPTVSRSNPVEKNRGGKRNDLANNQRAIGVESEDRQKSVIRDGISDNVTVSRSNPVEQNRGGNRDDSANNRCAIGSESENSWKPVTAAGKADPDGKVEESKTKKKHNAWRSSRGKNRAKAEEKGTIEEGSAPVERNGSENRDNSTNNHRVIDVESEERRKSVIGGGIEVDEKVEELTENNNNGRKGNWKWKKMKTKVKEKGAIEEDSVAEKGDENAEKSSVKIEWKEVKKVNSETVEDEAEQKFRVLSMNSAAAGNGKQNWKLREMNCGFGRYQSVRNNRNGSRGVYGSGGNGHGNGHFREQQSSKVMWVKKDNSVGEIETT